MSNCIHLAEEAMRCLLCQDAPCTRACTNADPARAIRAIRFDNQPLARQLFAACTEADLDAAEQACIHYDRPIHIKELAHIMATQAPAGDAAATAQRQPDLGITFCGIRCENPFFLASSSVCTNYEMVARAFDAGWAGVFFKTICLQDISEVSPRFDAVHANGRSGDFYGFRNMEQLSENSVEEDFDILSRLKHDFPSKVVVASIMGQTEEQWAELARMAQQAGVDAVELNFSCPQMRMAGMGSDVGQDSELVAAYTASVRRSVGIPVIAKMTPNITHICEPAIGACSGGANAISAINTIKSVTMSDASAVADKKTISGFSGRAVRPIALRHILEMAGDAALKDVELSGVGGIETWRDALEFMQLGCRNVQVCTSVMQYGYRIIDDLVWGMRHYLDERGCASVEGIVGEEISRFVTPAQMDRTTVVYPKIDHEKCIGCGRCSIACHDGGHQAIAFDVQTRQPRLIGKRCVGCHLCRLVCPVGAIGTARRVAKTGLRQSVK